uniref:GH02603p2 n=1 Tax=Drosophila melanogaster TaxID=7227 RepID=N0A2W3_DROME|nr:GH02603p2 [Drosophila melanogaster]
MSFCTIKWLHSGSRTRILFRSLLSLSLIFFFFFVLFSNSYAFQVLITWEKRRMNKRAGAIQGPKPGRTTARTSSGSFLA